MIVWLVFVCVCVVTGTKESSSVLPGELFNRCRNHAPLGFVYSAYTNHNHSSFMDLLLSTLMNINEKLLFVIAL